MGRNMPQYSAQTYPQIASAGTGARVLSGAQAQNTVAAPAAATSYDNSSRTMTMAAGGDFHEQAVNQNGDELRLISLGCYCGPKLSFRALGRDAETLPFDWARTRIDGLLHYIKNDFDKWFDYDIREVVPGCGSEGHPMVTYRDFYHSFWHDDLGKEETFDKYRRRMERFQAIDAQSKPVLFARTVATSEEFMHTGELYDELQQRFGRQAKLLIMVDFQQEDELHCVNGRENLLVAKLHHRAHDASNNGAPYQMPIKKAIEWIKTGRLQGMTSVPSLSAVQLAPTSWGLQGLGGLPAFEKVPSSGIVPLQPAQRAQPAQQQPQQIQKVAADGPPPLMPISGKAGVTQLASDALGSTAAYRLQVSGNQTQMGARPSAAPRYEMGYVTSQSASVPQAMARGVATQAAQTQGVYATMQPSTPYANDNSRYMLPQGYALRSMPAGNVAYRSF